MIIKNTNTRSRDYDGIKDRMRPGHADYPARVKYMSFNDYRGGGHFSGRLTAGLVFAGAIAKSIIKDHKIDIYSQIVSIGPVEDEKIPSLVEAQSLSSMAIEFSTCRSVKEKRDGRCHFKG